MVSKERYCILHIDGLVQDCSITSALALGGTAVLHLAIDVYSINISAQVVVNERYFRWHIRTSYVTNCFVRDFISHKMSWPDISLHLYNATGTLSPQ